MDPYLQPRNYFHPVNESSLDMVINDQWRALSDQFINEELMEQPLFALLRQDDPLSVAGRVTMDELRCRIRGGFNAGIRVARLPSSM